MSTSAVLLVFYVSLALGTSFLCSLLDLALLSTREIELVRRAEQGEAGALRLLAIKRERIDDAISAILTLNTIAHTIGATLAGAEAAIVFGDAWIGVFSGVLTFVVLVLTEIIPKTLGNAYASRLVGFVGLTTGVLMKALAPILYMTRLITRWLTRGRSEPSISRREVAAMVSLAAQQGTMKAEITRAVSNLLRFEDIRVRDVMTPRTVCWTLPASATVDDLLADPAHRVFSRVPLYEGSPEEVKGYAMVREVLAAAARSGDRSRALRDHLRPIHMVPEKLKIAELLRRLLEWREHIALAVDEFGGIEGVVTLEDALETILGQEILDELDTVADLRALATELRDRRLARHEREHISITVPPPAGE